MNHCLGLVLGPTDYKKEVTISLTVFTVESAWSTIFGRLIFHIFTTQVTLFFLQKVGEIFTRPTRKP